MFSGLSKEGRLCPLAVASLAVAAGCPLCVKTAILQSQGEQVMRKYDACGQRTQGITLELLVDSLTLGTTL